MNKIIKNITIYHNLPNTTYSTAKHFLYICTMKQIIEILSVLGERLSSSNNETLNMAIARAQEANEWFSSEEILRSIDSISKQMLSRAALTEWMSHYPALPAESPKRVAIIMAGNIPLVGLFDLICTLMAGHKAWIKPSSKDRVLMEYIIDEMRLIETNIPIYIYDDTLSYDAVIATGGESANRYFKSRFKDVNILPRGNRHSIAVLTGKETREQIEGLSSDIYTYSGLGCRNVSMIFLPSGTELEMPSHRTSTGYHNNYLQQRAIYKLSDTPHFDNGSSIFINSDELPSALSVVSIYEYSSLGEVEEWIKEHDDQLQCIVTESLNHPRAVGFGQAQSPTLMDYPDAIDVMKFLEI